MDDAGRERMVRKLDEQLKFIERSCEMFDAGHEEEALRLATHLRVIFYDTGSSVSLATHLQLKQGKMLSTPSNSRGWQAYLVEKLDLASKTPVRMAPRLGENFGSVSFKRWWVSEIVFVYKGLEFSRSKVILSAANKDGGAHVDKELDKFYEALCLGDQFIGITGNLTYDGAAPFKQGVTIFPSNGHLALIRQFAHEVLMSARRYSWPRQNSE